MLYIAVLSHACDNHVRQLTLTCQKSANKIYDRSCYMEAICMWVLTVSWLASTNWTIDTHKIDMRHQPMSD